MSTIEQSRMKETVRIFQEYVKTYSDQKGYDTYREETFLNDMLYGLGIAIDKDQYSWAGGYDKWRVKLLTILSNKKFNQ